MRRLSVMAGAMSAAMAVSSIAYAQQPPPPAGPPPVAPPPAKTLAKPPTKTPTKTPGASETTAQTWTLFLVTVLYKSGWSVSAVAAFGAKGAGAAHADCLQAIAELYAIPGMRELNAEAQKTEGNTQYLICMPASAASPQRG